LIGLCQKDWLQKKTGSFLKAGEVKIESMMDNAPGEKAVFLHARG
jgi:hypothetical protein